MCSIIVYLKNVLEFNNFLHGNRFSNASTQKKMSLFILRLPFHTFKFSKITFPTNSPFVVIFSMSVGRILEHGIAC